MSESNPAPCGIPVRKKLSHMRVFNVTRQAELARRAEIAGNGAKRTKGLLGRKGLAAGEGMWIVPCEAIHTFGMQFAIDLVYIDKNHCVKKVRSNVPPWRISACLSAHSVLELPPGIVGDTKTQEGDILELSEPAQESESPTP